MCSRRTASSSSRASPRTTTSSTGSSSPTTPPAAPGTAFRSTSTTACAASAGWARSSVAPAASAGRSSRRWPPRPRSDCRARSAADGADWVLQIDATRCSRPRRPARGAPRGGGARARGGRVADARPLPEPRPRALPRGLRRRRRRTLRVSRRRRGTPRHAARERPPGRRAVPARGRPRRRAQPAGHAAGRGERDACRAARPAAGDRALLLGGLARAHPLEGALVGPQRRPADARLLPAALAARPAPLAHDARLPSLLAGSGRR